MPELTEPWADPDDELAVLVDLVLPAAQAQYSQAVQRWTALDAKSFGLLGVAAAVIAGLAAAHDAIHEAWWVPATGLAVAGAFFVGTVLPRDLFVGPEIVDFHDEMRAKSRLEATRTMVEVVTDVTEQVEEGYDAKGWRFHAGLAILAVSAVGCLPILLARP